MESKEDPKIVSHETVSKVTKKYVYTWETIKSFGPNTTYTDCEGITRLHFINNSTVTTSSLVTATIWRRDVLLRESSTKSLIRPKCTFKDTHIDFYCRKLYARYEIGGDSKEWMDKLYGDTDVDQTICPVDKQFGCEPTLDEVVLLYWPEDIAPRKSCSLEANYSQTTNSRERKLGRVFTTDAITFRGQDLYLRSVNSMNWMDYYQSVLYRSGGVPDDFGAEVKRSLYKLMFGPSDGGFSRISQSVMSSNFRFTSPTIYLAYRPITFAMLSGHKQSITVREASVIPLKKEDVSTVRPDYEIKEGSNYAQLVANGSFHPVLNNAGWPRVYQTLPLDFGNLIDPVPASAYYEARYFDCWGEQSHCATITDDSFRPNLRVNRRVWSSLYSGFTCADFFLNDPPISIHVLPDGTLEQAEFPDQSSQTASGSMNHPTPIADYPLPLNLIPQPGPTADSPHPLQTNYPKSTNPHTPNRGSESATNNHQVHKEDYNSVLGQLISDTLPWPLSWHNPDQQNSKKPMRNGFRNGDPNNPMKPDISDGHRIMSSLLPGFFQWRNSDQLDSKNPLSDEESVKNPSKGDGEIKPMVYSAASSQIMVGLRHVCFYYLIVLYFLVISY
jgi:hypothetical protein